MHYLTQTRKVSRLVIVKKYNTFNCKENIKMNAAAKSSRNEENHGRNVDFGKI